MYDRFRRLLDQLQRSAVPLDAWECAVLDRALIAMRRGSGAGDADLAKAWFAMAEGYLEFFMTERVKATRAMHFLAAPIRPVADFIEELERSRTVG